MRKGLPGSNGKEQREGRNDRVVVGLRILYHGKVQPFQGRLLTKYGVTTGWTASPSWRRGAANSIGRLWVDIQSEQSGVAYTD